MVRHKTGKLAWQEATLAWPEGDRDWAASCAAAMLLAGASQDRMVAALTELLATVQASGQHPEALFGTARAHGRTLGLRLVPAPKRLERDLTFSSIPQLVAITLTSVGGVLALLGLSFGVSDGWNASSFQGKVILLFPIMGVLMAGVFWGWTVRTRGRLRLASILWTSSGIVFAVLPATMMALPELLHLRLPAWALVMVGIAMVTVGVGLPKGRTRALVNDKDWGTEDWFSHAEALLRGRYLLSRRQARAAVEEARAHWAMLEDQQGSPEQEFGNVEIFVAGLAAGGRNLAHRTIALRKAGYVACAGALCTLAVMGIVENSNWWLGVALALLTGGLLLGVVRSSAQREAMRLQRQRRSDAATLEADHLD